MRPKEYDGRFTPEEARSVLDGFIRGWAHYHCDTSQLVKLREVRNTFDRILDPLTRMTEIRTMPVGEDIVEEDYAS